MSRPAGRPASAVPRSLAVLVWRLGTGPFLDGMRTSTPGRWRAAALGAADHGVLRLALDARRPGARDRAAAAAAVAAYYRSQFLNVTLPGGVWATSTAGSATAATSATSASGCGPSCGNAPPARSCRPS